MLKAWHRFFPKEWVFPTLSSYTVTKNDYLLAALNKAAELTIGAFCKEVTTLVDKNVASVIERMSAPIIEELGLEQVGVEFVKEGGIWILRVYIDKPGGVNHDDCHAVSQRLDILLDENDLVPFAYNLEVSSPGIERPLKKLSDFERFNGHMVIVTTYAPINGHKKFIGKLGGVEKDIIILEEEGSEALIPLKQVSSARLFAEL